MKPSLTISKAGLVLIIATFTLLVIVLTPLTGTVSLDLGQVWKGDPTQSMIFWTLRVPRVLLAALSGAVLAGAGTAFQAIFRNDLATPFTLGIASGASLGAVIAIHLGLDSSLLEFEASIRGTSLVFDLNPLPLAAFAGAAGVVGLVFMVSRALGARMDATTILLTGVTISFFSSALILLMQYLSDFTGTNRMIRWMMGGLDTVGYSALWQSMPFVLIGMAWTVTRAPILNHLLTGDLLATSRGINVSRERALLLLAASLMVGAVIAFTGPIGFVGLIVPHGVRRIIGSDHRWLLPASILAGAGFLPLCDMVARTIIAPAELPVGVLTALLGAPFFLLILIRSQRR